MKKIIIGTSVIVGAFTLLVGIIFVVLTVIDPDDEKEMAEIVEQNSPVQNKKFDLDAGKVDSLTSNNNKLLNELQLSKFIKDSLEKQLAFKDNLIKGYKKTIEKLDEDILAINNQRVRVKELAKTFESMKTEEMRPILENVDNETVMSIYSNMNSRTRKNILIALSKKRASIITQRLAKRYDEKITSAPEDISIIEEPFVEKELPQAEPIKVNNSASSNNEVNGYRVQLYSGLGKGRADAFISEAEDRLNAPMYIDKDGSQYKVRAGNFSERDTAAKLCKHLREQGFKDAWVVRSPIENIQLAQP